MKTRKKEKVLVAMSGGVDSSVAALLLKEQGFDVIGVTLKLMDSGSKCCSVEDTLAARKVAKVLDIPFYVLNFKEFFKKEVLNYYKSEYFNARTPNPCIICNDKIKFYHLMNYAEKLKCKFLATGHYANIVKNNKDYALKKGEDRLKDQSYFLFTIGNKEMSQILFPLGSLIKKETRGIAKKANLPVADKKESQDICFDSNILSKKNKGKIIDDLGNELGDHNGIWNYTIGQRKGLGISRRVPSYVVALDKNKNQVVVGDKKDLYKNEFSIDKCIWNKSLVKNNKFRADVLVRYRTKPKKSEVEIKRGNKAIVRLFEPQLSIAPGQAAVFYKKDFVIGGGWIE